MNLVLNKGVKLVNSDHKVFCHEDYAQELYNLYMGESEEVAVIKAEEVQNGTIVGITPTTMYVQANSKQTFAIDLTREQKYLNELGVFGINDSIKFNCDPLKGVASLSKVHKYMTHDKLQAALAGEDTVFTCKVKSRNTGGYFVDIDGVDCYLPGSLAGANKIIDFDSLLGKKITVMVDSFLKEKNCFIVSNKKWINKVLPEKIKTLLFTEKYKGTVTGALSTGIFLEFDGIFTAFMHSSEMTPATQLKFENKEYKPGSTLEFYIKEISANPIKIVVSEKLQENIDWRVMKLECEDMLVSGEVIFKDEDKMTVKLSDSISCDIPLKNAFKTYKINRTYEINKKYTFHIKSIYPDEQRIVLYETKQQIHS